MPSKDTAATDAKAPIVNSEKKPRAPRKAKGPKVVYTVLQFLGLDGVAIKFDGEIKVLATTMDADQVIRLQQANQHTVVGIGYLQPTG